MKRFNILIILVFTFSMVVVISFGGCKTTGGGIHVGWGPDTENGQPSHPHKVKKHGPPPHAPAHGYRAKYEYRYFPTNRVYFDPHRKLYFYLKGDSWKVAASLPRGISFTVENYVTLAMDTDKPYTQHEAHSRKYPPGQMKKKDKKWAKHKKR
jgi:hypothetical protein